MAEALRVEQGMSVTGRLRADGDLTIAGFVEGKVVAEGKVEVERTGVVRADITAQAARIAGTVVGDVTAEEGVEIAGGGRLEGDIIAPRVLLREGAAFLGQVAMGPMVATSNQVQAQDDRRSSALPPAKPAFEPVVPEAEPARTRTVEGHAEVRGTGEPAPIPEPDEVPIPEHQTRESPQVVSHDQDTRDFDEPSQRRAAVHRTASGPTPTVEAAPREPEVRSEAAAPAAPAEDPLRRRVTVRRKV